MLAYSGGLDTSVILRWLIENYRCEVVAFCADVGQGEELIPVREKALRTGASRVHIVDLREEFVRDFVFPMLRANAVYEGDVPARHLDRAPAHREGAGGGRAAGGRRRGRARRHRQGQRPGALRADLRGAGARTSA